MLKKFLLCSALTLGVTAAHADIIFQTGNHPQPLEENILFQNQYTNLTNFLGHTNQTNVPITFDLPGSFSLQHENFISDNGLGQADIVCDPGGGCGTFAGGGANGLQLEDLEVKVGAGFGATDFIGNLDFGEGTFDINVLDQMGHSFDYILGNGQNFFTLTAINGEVITDIQILGEQLDGNGHIGFNEFKQPRISGLCALQGTTCQAIPVPEPVSLSLMGAGLMLLALFGLRKRGGKESAV
jgi:hypothetical protein